MIVPKRIFYCVQKCTLKIIIWRSFFDQGLKILGRVSDLSSLIGIGLTYLPKSRGGGDCPLFRRVRRIFIVDVFYDIPKRLKHSFKTSLLSGRVRPIPFYILEVRRGRIEVVP